MKAIVCAAEGSIHINSFRSTWTPCECGNVRAKWLDPRRGTVVVAARDRQPVRLLGLHNDYLAQAFIRNPPWMQLRAVHDEVTKSPGYIFDESKANCWAVVIEVGRTNDVRWASDAEFAEAFGQEAT